MKIVGSDDQDNIHEEAQELDTQVNNSLIIDTLPTKSSSDRSDTTQEAQSLPTDVFTQEFEENDKSKSKSGTQELHLKTHLSRRGKE